MDNVERFQFRGGRNNLPAWFREEERNMVAGLTVRHAAEGDCLVVDIRKPEGGFETAYRFDWVVRDAPGKLRVATQNSAEGQAWAAIERRAELRQKLKAFRDHNEAMLLAQRLLDMHEDGLIGLDFSKSLYDLAQGEGFTDYDPTTGERWGI